MAVVNRQAHNLMVVGSNPAPATNKTLLTPLSVWMEIFCCLVIVSYPEFAGMLRLCSTLWLAIE